MSRLVRRSTTRLPRAAARETSTPEKKEKSTRRSTMTTLALDQISTSPSNPRKSFDDDVLRELAASIAVHGVINPITVRPHPRNGGRYEVVAGEQRFRAAKIAKLAEIPVVVRPFTDREVLEIQIIENGQRKDVDPLEEAAGFRALQKMDPEAYTIDVIAQRIGKSRRHVFARLQLAEVDPVVQAAMRDGVLSASVGMLLARLTPQQQQTLTRQMIAGTKRHPPIPVPSVEALEDWIARNIQRSLPAAPFDKEDATLSPRFGKCTTCAFNTTVNPDAYPGVKAGTCMHPDDYTHKVNVHLEREAKRLQAENPKTIKITTSFQPPDAESRALAKAGVKPSTDYVDTKKNAADAVPALVVHGPGVGTVKYVAKKTDRQPAPKTAKAKAAATKEKQQRSQEVLEQRITTEARQRVLLAIQRKAKLNADTMRRIIGHLCTRSYDMKGLLKGLGWVERDATGSKYDSTFTKAVVEGLARKSLDELAGIALVAVCSTDDPFGRSVEYGGGGVAVSGPLASGVRDIAKMLNIDIAAIRAKTATDLKAIRKAKAAGKGKKSKAA